jgi:predicted ribosome quality control (RQC) complex YloA/Tae2 family protein
MFFDAVMLARARAEIARGLVGPRVRDVLQLHHDEVALVFRREPPLNTLLLSSSPQFGRVHLSGPPDGKGQPHAFGLALRKHLRGARLQGVSQPGFDRVLRMEFDGCEGFGPECRRWLIVEVMGKHGNMVLVGEDNRIISCAKHVPARLNRYREIMEGEPYIPPPTFDKLDPREATPELVTARIGREPAATVADLLHRHFLGASKVFCAEVLARPGEMPEAVAELTSAQVEALTDLLRELPAQAESTGPVYVYERPQGADLPQEFAYPLRLHCCGSPVGEFAHLGEALTPLVRREQTAQHERELRQRLESAARAHLKALSDRLNQLRAKVRKAERAEGLRRTAELLLAQPHAAKSYAREVELTDYYTEGAPTITVELDPPGDPQGTAQKLFHRYKREARALKRVPPFIEEAEQEVEYLESVLVELELADGLDDLAAIEEELAQQGYLRERQQVRREVARSKAKPQPRRQTSTDGLPVLYGTNHLQNDELVRLAGPDDLWLHVQGAPGAHVLIRTAGHPERVPRRTLIEAASIAARFSRLRSQETVDVDYTYAKHVRKPKGERPGMVYYTHQKTITVRVA